MACVRKEEFRKELFDVNTRVLALENDVQDKNNQEGQRFVSASGQIQELQNSIRTLKGEIDRLEIGVREGELPGGEQKKKSKSIASQVHKLRQDIQNIESQHIKALEERLRSLELTQNKILILLEKLDKKKTRSSSATLKTRLDFKKAYNNKQYVRVTEQAPALLAAKKKVKDINSIHYFYAESLFKIGRLQEAAIAFGELIQKDPFRGNLAARLRLRMGDAFRLLGDYKTAKSYYQIVLDDYPKSDSQQKAQELLEKLNG